MSLRWNKSLIVAYKNVFDSPDGKLVLEDLCKRTPLMRKGLNGATVDVNMLLVLEGQSNIVKHIYEMIGKDPNEEQPSRAVNRPVNETS